MMIKVKRGEERRERFGRCHVFVEERCFPVFVSTRATWQQHRFTMCREGTCILPSVVSALQYAPAYAKSFSCELLLTRHGNRHRRSSLCSVNETALDRCCDPLQVHHNCPFASFQFHKKAGRRGALCVDSTRLSLLIHREKHHTGQLQLS